MEHEHQASDPPMSKGRVSMMRDSSAVLALLDDARARLAADQNVGVSEPKSRETIVNDLIASRRLRERIFASSLFADPAWDILLGLYRDHLRDRPSYVKDACCVSIVPATTAMRWLVILESQGLIERAGDEADQRRVCLRLTPLAVSGLERYFSGQ